MAVKFELVKAGDVLYDVHREKAGHTNMSRLGCWEVKVEEINHEEGWAMCRWNVMNPPKRWSRRRVEKLRRSKPKSLK